MYPRLPVKALPGDHDQANRFLELIDGLANKHVAIIGDVIADEFIYGRIERVSREAPVLILNYDSSEIVAGGAGNAANNVAALGGQSWLCGLLGRDPVGESLLAGFQDGVETSSLVRPHRYRTPTKTRILAGGVHSAKQQVVRIDRTPPAFDSSTSKVFLRAVQRAVRGCDAVILSDYGSGLVTPTLAQTIKLQVTKTKRRRPVPIVIDSRYHLLDYKGFTACTPNEGEVEQLLGFTIGEDTKTLEKAGRTMLKRLQMAATLITRGSRGMALFERKQRTAHVPIFGSDEIVDVTGAGDTVIATLTLALAAGASMFEATRLANYASGLVVMKRGTATVTVEELREAVIRDHELPEL
ncbi:MAG: PfkB family carbohydrate kinase [Acidobacteriota bacterium]|nr:PfkB family carbohydrate kinase [Acidobacteriota bacterium]